MSNLDSSFEKLLGRTPTDAEKQNLYKVQTALQLGNNDALWLVLMALESYKQHYEVIPDRIKSATEDSVKNIQAITDATVKASTEKSKADLAAGVAEAVQKIAKKSETRLRLQGYIAAGLVACLCFLAVGWSGYYFGRKSGKSDGYKIAYDEKAWTATTDGRSAFIMSRRGDLSQILDCSAPGWYVKNNVCFPNAADDGLHGWRLP